MSQQSDGGCTATVDLRPSGPWVDMAAASEDLIPMAEAVGVGCGQREEMG